MVTALRWFWIEETNLCPALFSDASTSMDQPASTDPSLSDSAKIWSLARGFVADHRVEINRWVCSSIAGVPVIASGSMLPQGTVACAPCA
jgi:hypothetical protein